jgi:hypothetical protein
MPWIDSGVDGGGLLARVNGYAPGLDAPCLECAWEQADYDALEQRYLCHTGAHGVAATNAPAELGGLAASLMAIECRKVLAGEPWLEGKQVLIDARHYKQYETAFRRNPRCRFDHEYLDEPPQRDILIDWTLGQLRQWGRSKIGHAEIAMTCTGRMWAVRLACVGCGAEHRGELCLTDPLPEALRTCKCGDQMAPVGFELQDSLKLGELTSREQERRMSELGVRVGDVLSLESENTTIRAIVSRKLTRDAKGA